MKILISFSFLGLYILRFSGRYLAMIHVLKNMLRFTTIGLMCRKHCMPILPKFPTDGLPAGE